MNNINYKKYNKIINGGKVIGSGSYGCVFKPALRCKTSKKRYNGISKLLISREADHEWNQLLQIKKIVKIIPNYNKYFLLNNLEKCLPKKLHGNDLINLNKCIVPLKYNNDINDNLHNYKMINMPNAGIPIKDIITRKPELLYKINILLINLLKNAIIPMNKLGLYHCDLKSDNILYKNNSIKIIDWGLSSINSYNNMLNIPLSFNGPFSSILFAPEFSTIFFKL